VNLGAWDDAHGHASNRWSYGRASLPPVAAFVGTETAVEDWGCGGGALADYLPASCRYIGVDGSATPFADFVVDLRTYRSEVPAVVLRHVLEHNDEWSVILDNAIASAQHRLAIVLFTPMAETETAVLFREPDYGDVPVISFRIRDLMMPLALAGWDARSSTYESPDTVFGVETILLAAR
jgi:hypothetical protein